VTVILSGHLIALPYGMVWRDRNRRGTSQPVAFYCGDLLDWIVFEPIQRYLPPIPVVARDRSVQRELSDTGVSSSLWPAFPRAVIMARHALHRFPLRSIAKIGLRHGAYHFKQFIRPERYNAFDLFLFTSTHEVREAAEHGITSGAAGGFPKLDPMFQPGASEVAEDTGRRIGLNPSLPTVLFTSTWDGSGMAAIDRWCSGLHALANEYNVMVTTHPKASRRRIGEIVRQRGVHFIRDRRIWPYLLLADVMVGDTSSILAEFCTLDKPMITFQVRRQGRMTAETEKLLARISLRIDSFEELAPAIKRSLERPGEHSAERQRCSALMFDEIDGAHGQRAAGHILRFLEARGPIEPGA